MNLRFIDRIWRVRDCLVLEEPQSAQVAFAKLDPLFQATGTRFDIDGDTLTFTKDNPAAQDKMATFTRGTLQLAQESGQSRLRYDLTSPALLFCFLAPFLFLAFAQMTIALGALEQPAAREAAPVEEAADQSDEEVTLHPIDIALGAPAPDKPDEEEEEEEGEDDTHSPTAAYVLAAIFAVLYGVGRVLEPWLIKGTFRKALEEKLGVSSATSSSNDASPDSKAQTPGSG